MNLGNKEEVKKVEKKLDRQTYEIFDLSFLSPSTLNKMPHL